AFYAHSTRIVRDAARTLGYIEDAEKYDALYERVRLAFNEEFVTPNGRMSSPTQTAHVLPLIFDLLDEHKRTRVAADLNELIVERDYHLTTGFVGTPY